MTRNKTIFLAFTGQEIKQEEIIFDIQDGYELWDLKKFEFNDFIDILKNKIPPVNDNVLPHYKLEKAQQYPFGITVQKFQECSWGLLIPDSLDDVIAESYAETVFLLNLYSPVFLYPLFYASDFGIMHTSPEKPLLTFAHYQNQSRIF